VRLTGDASEFVTKVTLHNLAILLSTVQDLACFRGKPDEAVRQLKERFRLDLNDNGIRKYVDSLIDESLENWRTRWYDRYQRFCVGVL
jgi:phosphatidylinositol kinase/protein kinase (PI-3  family)